MKVEATVLQERAREVNGVEYVEVTCMDASTPPMLQMFDYGLRPEEKAHKGKLAGKRVIMQWDNIRAIFSGRPQVQGKLLEVK